MLDFKVILIRLGKKIYCVILFCFKHAFVGKAENDILVPSLTNLINIKYEVMRLLRLVKTDKQKYWPLVSHFTLYINSKNRFS